MYCHHIAIYVLESPVLPFKQILISMFSFCLLFSCTGSDHRNVVMEPMCSNKALNTTTIIVSISVVLALCLVLIIVVLMRYYRKPLRPKVKKTFTINKKIRSTPMTYRPTTQQCEITIEDCCNMNICDTVRIK